MESYTIKPILGIKNNVAQDDLSMFVPVSENTAATYCVECDNVDVGRTNNTASKSTGKTLWTNTANAQATKCQGLMELRGSTATDHLMWDNGKFYYVNGTRDLTNIDAAAPVTFGTTNSALISAIQFGDYVVFTDADGTRTPYKWTTSGANLTKLILAGGATEYKFRYLEKYQRRIIGAYSDQTNGDIEIRWTNALPAFATLDFPTANQLFKSGNDSIKGIKRFGTNSCLIYGAESIDSIDYYPSNTMPFGISTVVAGYGAVNHHSIVDVGNIHYFFNKHFGFCGYRGGSEFPAGGKPISDPIDLIIASINPAYYNLIVGTFVPETKQICWTVPANGSATPNTLLFYDILKGSWYQKTDAQRFVDYWVLSTSLTWNGLAALGYTYWTDFGNLTWGEIGGVTPKLVYANTNGHVYIDSGESDAGAALDGYRVEPIMSLGQNRSLLLELWFGLNAVGSYDLYCYHRGGDTVGECKSAAWIQLDDVSCDSPENAVIRTEKNYRHHQIKWGTSAASEPFSVTSIEFKFVPQGVY